MQNSATAWLNIEPDEIRRGSSRSTTAPSVRRPVTAITVMIETESAACARPTSGSMKAIWCTMKATCASSASENDPDTVQNGRLRSASRRVQAGSLAALRRRGRRAPAPRAITTGTRITTITAAAISIAV